jgi:hypothetical protein
MTTNYYSFLKVFGLLIFNLFIGHYFAPTGILLTPVILTICAWTIAFRTSGLNIMLKTICIFCCVGLNDIFIKLYSGGTHDREGLGWIHALTLIGLIPTFGILIKTILEDKAASKIKIASVILFPTLLTIYYYFFMDLGLGRNYPL